MGLEVANKAAVSYNWYCASQDSGCFDSSAECCELEKDLAVVVAIGRSPNHLQNSSSQKLSLKHSCYI